jgi:putative hydrolase of the HAD superfamily
MPDSRLQAVIFDYGNVLTQTLNPQPRARWEQRLGLAAGTLEGLVHNAHTWVAAQHGQITATAHWQEVGRSLRLTPDETQALQRTFYAGDVVNAALVTCLDRLRTAGIATALLSNFSTDLRTLLLQQDLLRRFDYVAISAEIGVMKPAALAYQTVLAMLALPATACVFIDDREENVAAAQALGMHGLVWQSTPAGLAALNRLLSPLLDTPRTVPS